MNEKTTKKAGLDVLGMQRAIRDDRSLTTSEKCLLFVCILRADNDTCKVRLSIQGLAVDAGMSDKTARSILQRPSVLRYFSRVEGHTRSKNLWLWSTPDLIPVVVTAMDATQSKSDSGNPVHDSGNPGTDSGNLRHDSGNGYRPSTLSSTIPSTLTSTKTDSASATSVDSLDSKVRKEEDSISLGPSTGTPDISIAEVPLDDGMTGVPPKVAQVVIPSYGFVSDSARGVFSTCKCGERMDRWQDQCNMCEARDRRTARRKREGLAA